MTCRIWPSERHWPGAFGASPPPPGSSTGAIVVPVSPCRSRGPCAAGAAALVVAFGVAANATARGPLAGDGVVPGSGVSAADVAEGAWLVVAAATVAGAPGTGATTAVGGGAGRRNNATAAVMPNAVAAATMAIAIHGGPFFAGTPNEREPGDMDGDDVNGAPPAA